MNDRELERLIGMAVEAADLERSADEPLRLVGHGPRRWVAGLGIATAAAASLALAFVLMHNQLVGPASRGPLVINPRPSVVKPSPIEAVVPAPDPTQCIVMAVYRGADGQCSCLNLNDKIEWKDGHKLADVNKREILDVAFQNACSNDAHQVLIVAVEGKPGTLPDSREQAEAIAARLSTAPTSGRQSDLSSYAYAAMPDLSPGTTVVAEQVAVRRAPLKEAAAMVGTGVSGW